MKLLIFLKALWFVIRQPRLAARERLSDKGTRSDCDGVTVITLRGSAYQRGFQHGDLLKADLARFQQVAWAYAQQTASKRLGLPQWLATLLTRPMLLLISATYLPAISASARAEMQGLADASGLPLREIVVQTVIWEVFAMLPGKPEHCSEFAFDGEHTQSGPLLGYNYDLIMAGDRTVVDTFLAIFVVEPDDGSAAYVAPNTIGSIGLNTAMNQHGVAFGWDNSYLNNHTSKGSSRTPYMLVLRDLALEARTITDAATRLGQETRPEADISVLADRQAVGVFECAGAQQAFRRNSRVWSCNRLQDLLELDYCGAGRPLDGRHERYPELMQATRPISPDACIAILRDQGAPTGRQIASPNTAMAVLYDTIGQRLWVSLRGAPASHQPMLAFSASGERQPEADIY